MRNSGTCRSETATARAWDAWSREGDPQAVASARGRVPVAGHRGGPACSSDEGRVSTRKVDRLVEQLGIDAMTKDRVSALCRGLDEQVEAFRARPLEGAHPYVWLDAKQVKVRDRGRVVSKALVVAYAVHESGVREVIGLDIGEVESGAFWASVPALLEEARAGRCAPGDLRSARGAQSSDRPRAGMSMAALHRPLLARHGDALPHASARGYWNDATP